MPFNEILRVIHGLLFFNPSMVVGIDASKRYISFDVISRYLAFLFDAAFVITA